MTFLEILILMVIFFFICVLIINIAMRRLYQTSTLIKKEVEDFKIPKIKLTDAVGYGIYQLIEMGKPFIQQKLKEWAKSSQKAGEIIGPVIPEDKS